MSQDPRNAIGISTGPGRAPGCGDPARPGLSRRDPRWRSRVHRRRRVLRAVGLPHHRSPRQRGRGDRPDPARGLLRAAGAADPPASSRGHHRHARGGELRALTARYPGHRRRRPRRRAVPRERPFRDLGDRLLRPGRSVSVPALLVALGRGAVLPDLAGRARARRSPCPPPTDDDGHRRDRADRVARAVARADARRRAMGVLLAPGPGMATGGRRRARPRGHRPDPPAEADRGALRLDRRGTDHRVAVGDLADDRVSRDRRCRSDARRARD